MSEMHDFSVVHDVLLAFQAQQGAIASFGEATRRDQVVVLDHFRADEATLYVRVNLARRLPRRRAGADGPGAALVLSLVSSLMDKS